ncbi:MAG: DNA-processing protein DprA [Eubacteriales bacterium]|nr:DNA-processing protein DprA [Eubacteriales bacterium]
MDIGAMEQYWVWLSSVEGIGPKRFYQLLSEYGDPRCVWDEVKAGRAHAEGLGPKTLAKLKEACSPAYFYKLFDEMERLEITPVTRISERYSELLGSIYDPPPTLYVKGNADLRLERPFAVVGTRYPTRDGKRSAEEFAERLARSGATIVSGMARGVDTLAHQGALKGEGRTVAVLGCGADIVYPPENEAVYRKILETGGTIVSEYAPGTPPNAQNFPARNRIISGLCEGTLIVEGGLKSGGMITAEDCLEQGRDLFVVPGSIYSSMSQGPNSLLMQGALPAVSPWDIPEHYRWASRPSAAAKERPVELSEEERPVVEQLRRQEMTLGELSAETGLNAAKLNSVLTMLELRGIICKVPGGAYRAK